MLLQVGAGNFDGGGVGGLHMASASGFGACGGLRDDSGRERDGTARYGTAPQYIYIDTDVDIGIDIDIDIDRYIHTHTYIHTIYIHK
jgi:hypothetical protein